MLKKISGVEFEDCWLRRVVIEDNDLRIPTISLADLKRNKLASGRKKDLLDFGRVTLETLPLTSPGRG